MHENTSASALRRFDFLVPEQRRAEGHCFSSREVVKIPPAKIKRFSDRLTGRKDETR